MSSTPVAPSDMDGERQGILSFFNQNLGCAKKTSDAPTDDTQVESVIDLEESETSKDPEGATKKELAAVKREEIKREREMKRLQREEDKRKRCALKEEQKRKREQQREEERSKREERKKSKELQRLELKKQRELEKIQKEQEKQKREEEKRAKEESKQRAQSRIGNFFKKVSDSSKQTDDKSDYKRYFLPFYAKDGVVLPDELSSRFPLERRKSEIDQQLSLRNGDDKILNWLNSKSVKRGGKVKFTAVSLLQQMTSKEKKDEELQTLLKMTPQKYIKFYENVRPPYIGTYSKDVILPAEDPFSTDGTGYNYDYDSDLEWINEEDEEGEQGGVDNLESGEEDEDEEDEEASEGEFEGFLDVEDGSNKSRSAGKRKFIGPLIPTVHLRSNLDNLDEDDKKYFKAVQVEYMIEQQPFPIDPYASLPRTQSSSALKRIAEADQDSESCSNSPSVSPEKKRVKALITETSHLLKLFNEIHDSTFSLGTVTEIAQKNLPQYSKQTIKNTVKEYAVRGTGKGELGKKWVIRDLKHWEDLRSV